MQIKQPCPGATHGEYISKAEHVSVACINVNVTNAGCLVFFFEGQCGGGKPWRKWESELQKTKLATHKVFPA